MRLEGGPADGMEVEDHDVQRIMVPAERYRPRGSGLALAHDVHEYVRCGPVFRWEGLVGDAVARMFVSADTFREPLVRRTTRQILRRVLVELAQGKEVDRIVWVVWPGPFGCLTVTAVAGGRRAQRAAWIRSQARGEPW